MDDLLGEDWQKPSKPTSNPPLNPTSFASGYSSFRASPQLQQPVKIPSAPISRPSSTVNSAPKPTNDSFGNLLGNRPQKPTNTLSIQERQKQLLEEKQRQQNQNAQLWDTFGSGRSTPDVRGPSPAVPPSKDDLDDILAAFNKDAPVDKSSHLSPPIPGVISGRSTPAVALPSRAALAPTGTFDDDDDPFGLGSAPKPSNGHARPPARHSTNDEDDILGDLGRPVSERPPPNTKSEPVPVMHDVDDDSHDEQSPQDRALAELVDMGFASDVAKIALAETGGDVQDAVSYLLQQAHEESKQKSRAQAQPARQRSPVHGSRSPPRRQRSEHDSAPAWMRQEAGARRQDSRSPANGEKDASQVAQELGSKLFKGANSLWKASQKQMAKTMADFQQERDSSQPKWMQEPTPESSRGNSQRRQPPAKPAPSRVANNVTDEAAMLDMPREPQAAKPSRSNGAAAKSPDIPLRGRSPAEPAPQRSSTQPRLMQQAPPPQDKRPATKLSRQDVEDQSAQAYVSPSRRKRPTAQPATPPELEVDLFSPAPAVVKAPTPTPASARPSQPSNVPRSTPTPVRPAAPPRNIPSISSIALAASTKDRKAGGEAFKRGDYAAAHESYTAALRPLPAAHPLIIIVLTNRSLTGLKTGDAKTAVSDADRALEIIGPSQGVGEMIDVGAGEGTKDMRDFFGKALMRKAEALEHMEKWTDGAAVWRQAVEAGVGGAVSLRGRDRCEKAAAPKPAPTAAKAAPKKPPPAKSLGNSIQRPTLTSPSSGAAVQKLRAANAAAEKADDEKFALTDQVDARLTAWKGGKADNLRALLQSLDIVLWAQAGWKKVGMSDLVIPNKVKIVYMKAIGKVHPDKIPQDATTEQRMISAAVFSTLNEAWDKFKTDNNL